MNENAVDFEIAPNVADLRYWLSILLKGWPIITAGMLVGLLFSVLFLQLAPPRYDAYLQLVPVERNSSSISRNLSGLASLAGINLVNEPTSQFNLALEAMTGRDVAKVITLDEQMMRRMFPEQWDTSTHQWHAPPDALRGFKDGIKQLLAMPVRPWSKPDATAVQEYVSKRLSTEENRQRGIATLIFRDKDPKLAGDILQKLYHSADEHLRERTAERTQGYINYISRKLTEVTLTEHRAALADALSDQERILMLARSGQPFSADALGELAVSQRPAWPNIPLVLAIGAVLGGSLGASLLLYRQMRPRNPKLA